MVGKMINGNSSMASLGSGLQLAYETFGRGSDPAILLIQGLGCQMIMWDDLFCGTLASRGFFVVRFDNRDVGQSTRIEGEGLSRIPRLLAEISAGRHVRVPYLLSDMAQDSFGLMDFLGIASAHVVGTSMGGMIAQNMAIQDPARLRSLSSISSTTGAPDLPRPAPEALRAIMTAPPTDREGFIKNSVATWRVLNGSALPFDEDRILGYARETFRRGLTPAGVARQIAAINASGSRREALRFLNVPALIIHGDADPLMPVECGIDTARAIPGAELKIIKGMGHMMPKAVWDEVIGAISDFAGRN